MALRNILFIFLSLAVLIFTSCSDFENDIYINADGSGSVSMKYDASEMISMVEMMKGMEGMEEGTEDEEEIEIDENIEGQDFESIMNGLGNPSNLQDVDSTFNFYEVMPDSVRNTIENPELLKNISMTINTSKSDMTAVMGMDMKYNSLEELEQIFDTMRQMGNDNDDGPNQMEGFKELLRNYDVDFKKGIVTLPEQEYSGDLGADSGEMPDVDFENMSEEESGMMDMMIGDKGYVTTLHLPGKVISCDDPDAIIDGNTITIKDSYMTLMKEKKFKARTINYKVK